jgi:hypothetical protein
MTFQVSQKENLGDNATVLPVGSFVKARVLSGVEANTMEPYPVSCCNWNMPSLAQTKAGWTFPIVS